MGKMRFGEKTKAVHVEPKPVPQNRPSPTEKMLAQPDNQAVKKVNENLEKFKTNTIAKLDKYKRRISDIPNQLESCQKKSQEYTDVKMQEMEEKVEYLLNNQPNLEPEMGKFEQEINRLCEENAKLKADYKAHLAESHKEHKKMYILMVILMLAAVAGIVI